MPKKFGIRMDGNEQIIENLFKDYLRKVGSNHFSYLEIGAAGCVTLQAIKEIVEENKSDLNWQVVGLDLIKGWSLDWKQINSYSGLKVNTDQLTQDNFQLVLSDDPRKCVRDNLLTHSVDICFVDGCHGKDCVVKDFNNIEPYIKPGGIVFFHDVGELEQGTDWQEHCQEFINVRSALGVLRLLNMPNFEYRAGWRQLGETMGTRMNGGWGNNCIFIQKL